MSLSKRTTLLPPSSPDIIMLFDVPPRATLLLTVTKSLWVSATSQVEAATIYGSNPQALNMTRQELEKSFDVGVVGIQVLATSEKVEVDGQNVTRISIAERVYELNGKEVVQGNQDDTVVGQIVDVYPDGHMVRQKACPMAVGEKLMPSPNGHRSGCMRRFAKWFNALNMSDKAIFVSASGTLILVFYAMIARLAYKLIRGDDEAQKEPFEFFNNDVVEEVKYEKVTISYEMPPSDPVSEEDDLPAYGPGYQAVATSEPKN
ncbi:hypothetical protein BC829DRAFT_72740 [Chytridium lagenaria]|nr:hypothetical protein BC829DRAFT_72740 [Chytridium lagenaria]